MSEPYCTECISTCDKETMTGEQRIVLTIPETVLLAEKSDPETFARCVSIAVASGDDGEPVSTATPAPTLTPTATPTTTPEPTATVEPLYEKDFRHITMKEAK